MCICWVLVCSYFVTLDLLARFLVCRTVALIWGPASLSCATIVFLFLIINFFRLFFHDYTNVWLYFFFLLLFFTSFFLFVWQTLHNLFSRLPRNVLCIICILFGFEYCTLSIMGSARLFCHICFNGIINRCL